MPEDCGYLKRKKKLYYMILVMIYVGKVEKTILFNIMKKELKYMMKKDFHIKSITFHSRNKWTQFSMNKT